MVTSPAREDDTPVSGPIIEVPSGKQASDENFPVGSCLIEPRLRTHVAAFYSFARAIDDIADSPSLTGPEKLRRLDGFEAALLGDSGEPGYEKARALAVSLAESGMPTVHGVELIAAFKQDAVKNRYDDWDELMAYCRLSAVPVGRYLIDLHGGNREAYPASDALCSALQVINHLQDCGDDYRMLDRIYLPKDWMDEARASDEDLGRGQLPPGMRKVVDHCLEECRSLMTQARRLPSIVGNRRLAMESAVIVALADALIDRLSVGDPLAARVRLSRVGALAVGGKALLRFWCGRGG